MLVNTILELHLELNRVSQIILKLADLRKPEIELKFEFELHLLKSFEASLIQVQSMPKTRIHSDKHENSKDRTPRLAMTTVIPACECIGNVM